MKIPDNYRGWRISFDRYGPASGSYAASVCGVHLSNSSWENLKQQIDLRPTGLAGPNEAASTVAGPAGPTVYRDAAGIPYNDPRAAE